MTPTDLPAIMYITTDKGNSSMLKQGTEVYVKGTQLNKAFPNGRAKVVGLANDLPVVGQMYILQPYGIITDYFKEVGYEYSTFICPESALIDMTA